MKKFLVFFAIAQVNLYAMQSEKVFFLGGTNRFGTYRTYATKNTLATFRIMPDGTQTTLAYNRNTLDSLPSNKTFTDLEAAYAEQQAKLPKTNS